MFLFSRKIKRNRNLIIHKGSKMTLTDKMPLKAKIKELSRDECQRPKFASDRC